MYNLAIRSGWFVQSNAWERSVRRAPNFFIIRNMFLCVIKNNLFTFCHLFFVKKTSYSVPEGFIILDFFVLRLSKCDFLVFIIFLNSFLHQFRWILQFSLLAWDLSFKNLFLYLDLLIMHLWSSLVLKGASFVRRYFFLLGTCLEDAKDWLLKQT